MNTITVQFQGDFSFVPEVPVPVEVMDSGLERVVEAKVRLGHPQAVEVSAPGLYLVRAELPSGQRVSTSVTVPSPTPADPDPSATATLAPRDLSPHETGAWAYTLQGVQRLARFAPAAASVPAAPFSTVERLGVLRNLGASDGVFRLTFDPLPPDDFTMFPTDPRVALDFPVMRQTLIGIGSQEWWPVCLDLVVHRDLGPVRLLVAVPPVPESHVVLIRDEDETAAHPIHPLVQGGDPRADALMAYLTRGSFSDARAIGDSITDNEIQEILYQKRRDPDSAIVSAYYQLRAGEVKHPEWVKNLADWFTKIPDGAIQYAWCLIRQDEPDYPSARSYFLMATQRGIPMYSYGVRLLYDGLRLFAERDPENLEVANAFRAVQRVAAATDWQAASTSLVRPEGLPIEGSGAPFVIA